MQKKKKSTKQMGPKPQYTRKEPKGPRIIAAKYNTSCVKADQYPEGDTVEIAFLGRSNVGKSSLINSLCNYRGLALVSGQPGKTKTINYFDIESKEDISETEERRYNWFLVDLPGYGFAKTNKGNRNLWSSFIADYILRRKAYENFEQAKFLNINWTAIVSVAVGVACGKLLPGIIPVNAVIGGAATYLVLTPLLGKKLAMK